MPKITPFLWFNGNAKEAVAFYTSVFKGSRVLGTTYYTKGMHMKAGTVLTVRFRILGQEFTALNGGPGFKFSQAISFMVQCRTQKEVDYYWRRLTAGGKEIQCGWLVDRFGLSWQVAPDLLLKLIEDRDKAKVDRVLKAMMKMVKIDIAGIRKAAKG
jgi:predicted 3-demethylubiquinone-9 3-methyltransferase (glyoxalase superfamily)